MNKFTRIVQTIFGIPWLVFGAQHFWYADFVAGLVPPYFPARVFWVYFTGAAMIAAGISFIVNRLSALAAALLGAMLLVFIMLLHTRTLSNDLSLINWTRAAQDLSIASTAFMLAGILSKRKERKAGNIILDKTAILSCYVFAVLLIVFGAAQFLNLNFLTAKVPAFLPLRVYFVYLTGATMIATGLSVIIKKKARLFALALGLLMLILNLLNYVPAFLSEQRNNALLLTAAMLDLAITCGVFILASALTKERE